MKKNQLTALKNKYYSNWGLLSKMKVGMAFMLLGTSPVVMANADKSNSDSVYEINQQTGLTLKGVVKDVKNEPLIGVNVLIKGTTCLLYTSKVEPLLPASETNVGGLL